VLAPSGLTVTQYSLLRTAAAGRAPTLSELAQQLFTDRTTDPQLKRSRCGLVEDMQMPPKGERLTVEQIGLFARLDRSRRRLAEATSAKLNQRLTIGPSNRRSAGCAGVKNRRWVCNHRRLYPRAIGSGKTCNRRRSGSGDVDPQAVF